MLPASGLFRLSEVTGALSHALDLTEGQPVGHSQRSCMIALEIAARMGLAAQMRQDLFYAMLLKDAGCSSSAARVAELFRADERLLKQRMSLIDPTDAPALIRWVARHAAPGENRIVRTRQMLTAIRGLVAEGNQMAETRCERGGQIVRRLGFSAAAAEAVKATGERWDGSGMPNKLAGDQIPLLARIASVSQTAEIFIASDGVPAAREMVHSRRGRWFDPEVADTFLSISLDDPLWERLTDEAITEAIAVLEPADHQELADEEGLDRVAEAFADVIDAKSPYTARHSRDVARYAVAIGNRMGFEGAELRLMRRAGLLHDIGKLGVSNSILDKPAKLTDSEFAEVRLHPLYSEQILGQVSAFAEIAPIASAHHERLDGRGYHRGLTGDQLSPAMRALSCADVYDALTAERPYRGPMEPARALEIMSGDIGTAFCPEAISALAEAIDNGEADPVRSAAGS